MKFEVKIYKYDEDYKKECIKYESSLLKYEKDIEVFNDEPYMFDHKEPEIPVEPKPQESTTFINIKSNLIIGYEIQKDNKESLLKLNLDKSKMSDYSYIIKYNDKIIEELDELLK